MHTLGLSIILGCVGFLLGASVLPAGLWLFPRQDIGPFFLLSVVAAPVLGALGVGLGMVFG